MEQQFTYLDIGIVALLIIFFFIGLKKGFIDTILGLIGGLVSLIAAILLASTVADMLYPAFGMGDSINVFVNGYLTKLLNPEGLQNNVFAVPIGSAESLGPLVAEAIGKLGLPETITNSLTESITNAIVSALEADSGLSILAENSLIEILSPIVTRAIMLVIATLATFIAIRIAVAILEAIFKAVLKTSRSLRSIDRLLGGIVGIVEGALAVVIVFTIGFFVLGGVQPDENSADLKAQVRAEVEKSTIAKMVYDSNPVPKLITDNINLDKILETIGLMPSPSSNPSVNPSASPLPSESLPPDESPEPTESPEP